MEANTAVGVGHNVLQARTGNHQEFYQDLDIVNDGRAQASQVLETTLREFGKDIRGVACRRQQGTASRGIGDTLSVANEHSQNSLADTLSVLGMTYSDEERMDTLKYRLLAPSEDLGSWGHEYMRHLALEIGQDYQKRLNEDKDPDELTALALNLVPFFLSNNAEADAVDILSELEMIEQLEKHVDENTYSRVCLYMTT